MQYKHEIEGYKYNDLEVFAKAIFDLEIKDYGGHQENVEIKATGIDIDTPCFYQDETEVMTSYSPEKLKKELLNHFNNQLSKDKDLHTNVIEHTLL